MFFQCSIVCFSCLICSLALIQMLWWNIIQFFCWTRFFPSTYQCIWQRRITHTRWKKYSGNLMSTVTYWIAAQKVQMKISAVICSESRRQSVFECLKEQNFVVSAPISSELHVTARCPVRIFKFKFNPFCPSFSRCFSPLAALQSEMKLPHTYFHRHHALLWMGTHPKIGKIGLSDPLSSRYMDLVPEQNPTQYQTKLFQKGSAHRRSVLESHGSWSGRSKSELQSCLKTNARKTPALQHHFQFAWFRFTCRFTWDWLFTSHNHAEFPVPEISLNPLRLDVTFTLIAFHSGFTFLYKLDKPGCNKLNLWYSDLPFIPWSLATNHPV